MRAPDHHGCRGLLDPDAHDGLRSTMIGLGGEGPRLETRGASAARAFLRYCGGFASRGDPDLLDQLLADGCDGGCAYPFGGR